MLRERKHLSQDGLIVIVTAFDRRKGTVVQGPEVFSRGFIFAKEAEDLKMCIRDSLFAVALYGRGGRYPRFPAARQARRHHQHYRCDQHRAQSVPDSAADGVAGAHGSGAQHDG